MGSRRAPIRKDTVIEQRAHELGDLYEREGQRLWRAVFAYGQSRAIADDAVAEAPPDRSRSSSRWTTSEMAGT